MRQRKMRLVWLFLVAIWFAVQISCSGGSDTQSAPEREDSLSSQLVINSAYVDDEENTLTIIGKNFGTEMSIVTLGDLSTLIIESWSSEEIVAALPGAAEMSGHYLLAVQDEFLPENYDTFSIVIGPVDAEDPVGHDQLVISTLGIDAEENTMIIWGYNFDNGYPPAVIIDGYSFPLVSYDDNEIVVDLLDSIVVTYESLLQVQTGDAPLNRDSIGFGVDIPTATDALSFATKTQSPAALYTDPNWHLYKEGPPDTNMWTGGQYGEPVYYQMLDDYEVDLKSYFTNRKDLPFGHRFQREKLYDLASGGLPEVNNEHNFLELTSSGILIIKKGYRWDGPSTEPFWHYPVQTHASLVHDALYDLMRLGEIGRTRLNRLLADCLFYMIAVEDGYPKAYAWLDFNAIRIGGWARTDDAMPSWKVHAVADPGPDPQIFNCGMPIRLDGSNSRFAKEWLWEWESIGKTLQVTGQKNGEVIDNISLATGRYIFSLTVDDGDDAPYKDRDDSLIIVNADPDPPVFMPVVDIIQANDPGMCSAIVDFTVTATDQCCDPEIVCEPSSGDQFPVGTTTVNCTATDTGGNESSTQFTVTVEDNEPPVVNGIEEPITMWPPNHKYTTFTIVDFVYSKSDNCTDLSMDNVMITKVTSDETENAQGGGDGNTMSDILLSPDGKSVDLRVERQCKGNGRVYTIYIEVVDESGNAETKAFQVIVPTSKKADVIDDGPAYSVVP